LSEFHITCFEVKINNEPGKDRIVFSRFQITGKSRLIAPSTVQHNISCKRTECLKLETRNSKLETASEYGAAGKPMPLLFGRHFIANSFHNRFHSANNTH